MQAPKHFLDIRDHDAATLNVIIDHAVRMKADWVADRDSGEAKMLDGYALTMIFEKPSTRTRVSFDLAMRQLGGEALTLSHDELQLGRGETIADTARVLSRYADIIMLRTGSHEDLIELSRHATVPVINGLTDQSHPCQVMADVMTLKERFGEVAGLTVAWVGDGNNVARSWLHAAAVFGFAIRFACPQDYSLDGQSVEWARAGGADVAVGDDPKKAVKGADCVVTDTWVSMSDEGADRKRKAFAAFQVNDRLMSAAGGKAVFMHCLPAHRGEEVTDAVIDGPQSVVWDEAENRLHVQKAILAWCLKSNGHGPISG